METLGGLIFKFGEKRNLLELTYILLNVSYGIEVRKQLTKRRIGIIGMVLTLIPIVALSFSPIVGISTLKIAEPLSVTSVTMTPAGVCTTTAFSFTCTVTMFAGDSGTLSVSIMNASNTPILVTLSSNSSNTDVEVTNPAPTPLPAGVATAILFSFNLLQSATPDTTTLHFTVTR